MQADGQVTTVPTISDEEFHQRQARAAELARERGLDGLLVWSRGGTSAEWYADVFYLTNHITPIPQLEDSAGWTGHGHAAVVVPADGSPPTLITDAPEDPDDAWRVVDVCSTSHVPQSVVDKLNENGLATKRIGLVGRETLLWSTYKQLGQALGRSPDFEFADEVLAEMRRVKSDAEIDLMRHAAGVGVEWMNTALSQVREGVTEGDVVGEGLRFLAANGGAPYDIAIASGPGSHHYWSSIGIPHWRNDRTLAKGDLVHLDQWGPVNGYYTDFCRSTVVGGDPTPAQAELLQGVVDLINAMIAQVRPGATGEQIHHAGQEWLVDNEFAPHGAGAEEAGHHLGEMFPSFGHCLGIGIETPWMMAGDKVPFEAGMVVAIESLLAREGVGAAGFEENVLVTSEGCEILTEKCPSNWWS